MWGSIRGHDAEAPPVTEHDVVSGAIRTDLILSAEIMVIALNEVADQAFVPAQHELGVGIDVVAAHGDVDLVEQAAQQSFSVFIGGDGRRPHAGEIVAEREYR